MADVENRLKLRAGDWVEVRSPTEILSTLDKVGALEGLLFMPEMLQYCGKRFQVYKRADKTCDTVANTGLRRMVNTVHLLNLRCDGEAHGGCEAGCLIFGKEAWLKRANSKENVTVSAERLRSAGGATPQERSPLPSEGELARIKCVSGESTGNPIYRCQATNLREASAALVWWDVRQYVRDLASGNVGLRQFVKGCAISMFNGIQSWRKGRTLPFDFVGSQTTTPTASLDLQEGELVQIRSKEEIIATLNRNNKNRGLWFDREMLEFCGGTYRVKKKVKKIVNEKTGKILNLPGECLILEGVFCGAAYNLFCPRSIYSYWREIWLRRVSEPAVGSEKCGVENPACETDELTLTSNSCGNAEK